MEGAPENRAALSLPVIVIWAPKDSPRLRYVLDWLFSQQLGLSYKLTNDVAEAGSATHGIAYGASIQGMISIPSGNLLFEEGAKQQIIPQGKWNGLHTLYHDDAAQCTLPFDLFSGIFFLLSRYEEYSTFEPDKHGRYPHSNSILYQCGVLETPLVDEWVNHFRNELMVAWDITIPEMPFELRATYDIDIAWSYKNKGAKRSLGAALRDILTGNAGSFIQRIKVLAGAAQDPYDAFDLVLKLHRKYKLPALFFILAAAQSSPFDKNIPLEHPAMTALIRSLTLSGPVGLHPSYFTHGNEDMLLAEKAALRSITGTTITTSRQHYIRVFLPQTYQALLAAGINEDYSMGYATALGFRAGTSRAFYWYDMEREVQTALCIHPFCFMDTTAHYDLGLSTRAAFLRLRQMGVKLRECGGRLTTVFHNFSLGSDAEWKGWREEYEAFVKDYQDE